MTEVEEQEREDYQIWKNTRKEKVLNELIEYKKRILQRENDEPKLMRREFYAGVIRGVEYAIELLKEVK